MLLEIIKANKVIIGAAAGGAAVGAGITEGINVAKNRKLKKDNELRLEAINRTLKALDILEEEEGEKDKTIDAITEEISMIIERKKLSKENRKKYEEAIGQCEEEIKQKETKSEEEQSEEKEDSNNKKNKNNKNNK